MTDPIHLKIQLTTFVGRVKLEPTDAIVMGSEDIGVVGLETGSESSTAPAPDPTTEY